MDAYAQLQQCLAEFHQGWNERREYKIRTSGGLEIRVEAIRHPSLIRQLNTFQGRVTARAERGAPNGPGSRPPSSLDALELLHEINTALTAWQPVTVCESADPDDTRACLRAFRDLRRRARWLLGYDPPTTLLDGHVCDHCGGALRVATDWSTDIRCAGHPDTPPCGTEYSRWQLAVDHIKELIP
ncbi:hypothetical protein [Streptomyces sp. NPDC057686]|uniref:DUF7341 domain-containing protein n=1 Tax=Streptomyces sp. NPDC057686 TaxID=3346212 RepID=UPI0036989516